jgi:hypothetical protein
MHMSEPLDTSTAGSASAADQRSAAALALLAQRFGQPPVWALDEVYRDLYGAKNPFPVQRTTDVG